jgi:hypothetical protein
MRVLALPLIALLAGCNAPQPMPQAQEPAEIAGRQVSGPPVHCVPTFDQRNFRVSENDRSTLVYGTGRTIWVNRLGPSCRISWNDIPVFEVTGSSYCRGDIVRTIDQSSHIPGPGCVLNDFVPYTKP